MVTNQNFSKLGAFLFRNTTRFGKAHEYAGSIPARAVTARYTANFIAITPQKPATQKILTHPA
jgi:hypothetical protein